MLASRRAWIWLALVDLMVVLFAFIAAFAWRFGWPPPEVNFRPFLDLAPFLVAVVVSVHLGFGLYGTKRLSLGDKLRTLIIAEFVLFLATAAMTYWLRQFALPRSVLVLAFSLHLVMTSAWHVVLHFALLQRVRVIILALPSEAEVVTRKLMAGSTNRYEVVHTMTPQSLLGAGAQRLKDVDALIIGPTVSRDERPAVFFLAMQEKKTVQVIPGLTDVLLAGSTPSQVDDLPMLEIRPLQISPIQRICKRTFDLSLGIVMFVCLLPVMGITALLIKLTSPGPIIFNQERVGHNGRPFMVWKFRTMLVDAEKNTGPVFATVGDPRVTSIGRILRATRLDELPQLWNVITGTMSLVGPRPERPFFVEQFVRTIPEYALRYEVPPGITGLAQVNGRYATTAADKLRFDLFYIRHYSVWLDLKVLLSTVVVLFSKESAAGVSPHQPKAVGD